MTEVEIRWRASSLTLAIATCAAAALGGAVLTGRADLVVFAAPLLGVLCSIGWQRRPPTVTVQAQPPLHRCFEDEAVRVIVTAAADDDAPVAVTCSGPAGMHLETVAPGIVDARAPRGVSFWVELEGPGGWPSVLSGRCFRCGDQWVAPV